MCIFFASPEAKVTGNPGRFFLIRRAASAVHLETTTLKCVRNNKACQKLILNNEDDRDAIRMGPRACSRHFAVAFLACGASATSRASEE